MKNSLFLKVKFTKIGSKVKYELPMKIHCTELNCEFAHSGVFDKNDLLWKRWLGNVDKAFKKCDVIIKKVELGKCYGKCDYPGTISSKIATEF
jgi:hypothetical protein